MTDDELVVEVAVGVAAALGHPPGAPTVRVEDAAAAAVVMARRYIYPEPLDPLVPPALPDPVTGPDFYTGCVALGVRVYHDPASPGGIIGAGAYVGAAIPEDILAHVHGYFDGYRSRAWGFA